MSTNSFIDSNIALYSIGLPSIKRDIARTLIKSRPCISTQVVMETMNVLLKKFKFDRSDAIEIVLNIMDSTELSIITENTLLRAFEITVKYNLSHWDSLIIASALEVGCSTLYTEDMQHGQIIEGKLNIVNPFIIS